MLHEDAYQHFVPARREKAQQGFVALALYAEVRESRIRSIRSLLVKLPRNMLYRALPLPKRSQGLALVWRIMVLPSSESSKPSRISIRSQRSMASAPFMFRSPKPTAPLAARPDG
jgi:hypothetical protein